MQGNLTAPNLRAFLVSGASFLKHYCTSTSGRDCVWSRHSDGISNTPSVAVKAVVQCRRQKKRTGSPVPCSFTAPSENGTLGVSPGWGGSGVSRLGVGPRGTHPSGKDARKDIQKVETARGLEQRRQVSVPQGPSAPVGRQKTWATPRIALLLPLEKRNSLPTG